jgi:4-amino-4-deoxy-L-arabinose transferase-like glycosyltransferase
MNLNEKSTYSSFVLFAILMVAAILRFTHINQPFVDMICWRQSSTAMMAENFYRTNWNIFYPEINWHGPGPSYNGREFQTVTYIAALLYNFVGPQEWVGRSIVAIFGLLGIFSLYQLVRRVWDNDRALMSAAVMALMPGSIFIERSFLPDPAMVALVTTSFWMLVAYLQTDRKSYLVLACLIGCLGFLTKLPGLIVGLPMVYAMVIYFIRQKELFSKRLLYLTIGGVLVLIPVILYYLWARHLSQTYPPYHFAGAGNWVWADGLRDWWHQGYFLYKLIHIFEVWFWTIPVIFLVILGLISPPGKDELVHKETTGPLADHPIKLPWLFHWWFLAFGFYYLIGARELVDNPWNIHILNPAAAALAGHALITIFSRWRSIAGKPIASIVLFSCILIIYWYGQYGLQWAYKPYGLINRQLGLALQKVSKPNELVVTLEDPIGAPVAILYSQRRGWVFPSADTDYWGYLPEDDQATIQIFDELRSNGADWFGIIVDRKEDIIQKHPNLFRYIDSTCELKEKNSKWIIYKIKTPAELAKLSETKTNPTTH